MEIDTTEQSRRGDDVDDLVTYLREYAAGGYPVARVKEHACGHCGGTVFTVAADDEEGCAATTCLACGDEAFVADSEEHADDADLVECACPCGGDAFTVATGFALRADGDVRWISVGLRCVQDGTVGVYTDWKIDYSPTDHLLIGAA